MDSSMVSQKLLTSSVPASLAILDRRVTTNGILYRQIRSRFSLSLAWLSRLMLVGSLSLVIGCGGGGDEGLHGLITIEQPTAEPTYTTESDVIRLSGSALAIPYGFPVVTWAGGQAQTWFDYCDRFGERVPCGYTHWSVAIPLVIGVNIITMKADGGSWGVGYDTITITRLPDTTPPTVASTTPVNSATNVSVDASIRVDFNEAMDAATLTTATFSLTDSSGNPVSGTVTGSVPSATFNPTVSLAGLMTYTATVSTGIRDAAGNAMAVPYTWSFTTGP